MPPNIRPTMKEVVVLASSSPRRAALLAGAGIPFEVDPSCAEEEHLGEWPPGLLVEWNAGLKAAEVAQRHPNRVVLGADTLVFLNDEPLGKPRGPEEASAMLARLSGVEHRVLTGVALIRGSRVLSGHAVTTVRFSRLDSESILEYHRRVNPLDKAGAYGIQEEGKMLLGTNGWVRGPLDNVVGLPVELVEKLLDRAARVLTPELVGSAKIRI